MTLVFAATDSGSPWTFVLSVVASCVSIATVSVALMNFKTAKDKLRLDLFDKRFRIYQAIVKLLDTVGDRSKLHRDELLKFWLRTRHHRFLFKQEIQNFMFDLRIRYTKIQMSYEKFHNLVPKGSSGKGLGNEIRIAEIEQDIEKEKVWFDHLKRTELARLFEPYLAFYHTSDKLISIEEDWN